MHCNLSPVCLQSNKPFSHPSKNVPNQRCLILAWGLSIWQMTLTCSLKILNWTNIHNNKYFKKHNLNNKIYFIIRFWKCKTDLPWYATILLYKLFDKIHRSFKWEEATALFFDSWTWTRVVPFSVSCPPFKNYLHLENVRWKWGNTATTVQSLHYAIIYKATNLSHTHKTNTSPSLEDHISTVFIAFITLCNFTEDDVYSPLLYYTNKTQVMTWVLLLAQ